MHRDVDAAALQRDRLPFPGRLTRQTGENTAGWHLNRQPRFTLVSGNHRLLPAHRPGHVHGQVISYFLRLPEHAPGTAAQISAAGARERDPAEGRDQFLRRFSQQFAVRRDAYRQTAGFIGPFRQRAHRHFRHAVIGTGDHNLRLGIQVGNIGASAFHQCFDLRKG